MPILQYDIVSVFDQKLYGAKDKEVIIIADHFNVMIVEDMAGNRFPVPANALGDQPNEVYSELANHVPAKQNRRQKKAAPIQKQTNLF